MFNRITGILILLSGLLMTIAGCGGDVATASTAPATSPPAATPVTNPVSIPVTGSPAGSVSGSGTPVVPPPTITSGQLKVLLETNPVLGFSEINLSINRVQVHLDANAAADATGWRDVTMPTIISDNFLNFTDRAQLLAQGSLPVGIYKSVKLVFAKNDSINWPNYLIGNSGNQNGKVFPIYLRSPQSEAFVIGTNIEIKNATTASLGITLNLRSLAKNNDFDSSVGKYTYTPIAAATDLAKMGSIEINLGTTDGTVVVSAQRSGKIVRNKIPTSTGVVKLTQLPFTSGDNDRYQVVLSSPNYATKVIYNFPVSISDKPVQFLALKEALTLDASDQKTQSRVSITQTQVNAPAIEQELLAVEVFLIVTLPDNTRVAVDYGYTPLLTPFLQNAIYTSTLADSVPQVINYLAFSSQGSSFGQSGSNIIVRINPDFSNAKESNGIAGQTLFNFR